MGLASASPTTRSAVNSLCFASERDVSVCCLLLPLGLPRRAARRPLAADRPDRAGRGRCASVAAYALPARPDRPEHGPHPAEPRRAHPFREHAVPARKRGLPARLRQGARGDREPDRRHHRSAHRALQPAAPAQAPRRRVPPHAALRPAAGAAHHRPRSLQAHQRHPRPPGGRRGAAARLGRAPERAAHHGSPGAPEAARSSPRSSRAPGSKPPPRAPIASAPRSWRRAGRSANTRSPPP